jgi:hypothetical protein
MEILKDISIGKFLRPGELFPFTLAVWRDFRLPYIPEDIWPQYVST